MVSCEFYEISKNTFFIELLFYAIASLFNLHLDIRESIITVSLFYETSVISTKLLFNKKLPKLSWENFIAILEHIFNQPKNSGFE